MLVDLHPNYIENNGKKEYTVIPFQEYQKILEYLEDYEDLLDLRKAKQDEEHLPGKSLEQVKEIFSK